MEHRYYPRLPALLEIDLYQRQRLLGRFNSHDISLDGLFVKTGPIGLERNDVIQLRIGIRSEKHWMQGIVVHTGSHGIGIMLDELNKEPFQAIFRLFKERQAPTKRYLSNIERHQGMNLAPSRQALISSAKP